MFISTRNSKCGVSCCGKPCESIDYLHTNYLISWFTCGCVAVFSSGGIPLQQISCADKEEVE
jgi:hypothetical protein